MGRAYFHRCQRFSAIRALAVAAAVAMGLFGTSQRSGAAIIYEELFPGSSAAAKNFQTANIGWQAHISASATDLTNNPDTSSNSTAVIWTTNGQDGTPAYAFSAGSPIGLFWTTEIGTQSRTNVGDISFYLNNGNNTVTSRVAIRLDNNTPGNAGDDTWYVSDTAYTHTGNGTGTTWASTAEKKTFTFTETPSAWRNLTFTPGTTLSVAASPRSTALPAGDINATGILFAGNSFRLDTFRVTDVPEPSSAMAVAACGLLFLQRRRRAHVSR